MVRVNPIQLTIVSPVAIYEASHERDTNVENCGESGITVNPQINSKAINK